MKVGFTATREGLSNNQRIELIEWLKMLRPTEVHHGMCEGGDNEFHDIVRQVLSYNCKIVGHPPLNKKHYIERMCDEYREPKDYIVRNHDIVDEVQVLIGCPKGEEVLRSGTWSTIRYAYKRFDKKLLEQVIVIER